MKKIWDYLSNKFRTSFRNSYQSLNASQIQIGYFFFAVYALYYYVWTHFFPEQYESLTLRIIGMAGSLGLILKNHWPRVLKQFQPWYAYFFMAYALSFFPAYLLFLNQAAILPLLMVLACFFVLVLLFEWITFNSLFIGGIIVAVIVCRIVMGAYPNILVYEPYIGIYVFIIIAASLFSYRNVQLREKMIEGMAMAGVNIAHELRTPLLGIKAGAAGIERYLPSLFNGYELAKQHGLNVPEIRKAHYDTILPTLKTIQLEANYANTVIDMLLVNLSKKPEANSIFALSSMRECVLLAIERYPFTSEIEKKLLQIAPEHDFKFYGSSLLMTHVLFNLIKNALYFIAKANKGEISIRLLPGNKFNELIFRDTGSGIAKQNLSHIFERFYTTTGVGNGVGLAFCKTVIEGFGGHINCESAVGEYTQFTIVLPSIE